VFGSEVLDYVVDEGVQIHGGMGYSAESRVERAYRDSRINRIFEGTNEINRLLIVDMILKKAMKGELDLMTPAMKVANELMSIPDFSDAPQSIIARGHAMVAQFKKGVLMVIQTYISESLLLRIEKLERMGMKKPVHDALLETYLFDASEAISHSGKEALLAFGEGDELRMMLMGLRRFTKMDPTNIKESRRVIAAEVIANGRYAL
jgi:hypothetical protein